MDQRLRERVAVITASLAKGLSVYAPPRHVPTEAEQMQMLEHIAGTVNRYIEPNVNDGVIRERIARAFSMLAATYDRRDWPTAAVMVEAVKRAKPERLGIAGSDWLTGKPLEVIRWLGYYANPSDYPGGNVINSETGIKHEDEARKRYNDEVARLSEGQRAEMHRRFDMLPQSFRQEAAE